MFVKGVELTPDVYASEVAFRRKLKECGQTIRRVSWPPKKDVASQAGS